MLKIRSLKTLRQNNEEGSALIFAMVLTIVLLSVVATVVAISLTSTLKTASLTKYTYNEQAAQSALAHAISVANSVPVGANSSLTLAKYQGVSKAVYGTLPATDSDQGIKWRWYTQRISTGSASSEYYVVATGYRGATPESDNMARTLRARVTSLVNVDGKYNVNDSGKSFVTYNSTGNGLAQWGIFGSESVTLNDGAQIKSYISDTTQNPSTSTNQAKLGSGGVVNLRGPKVALNTLNILSYSEASTTIRCTGTGCAVPSIVNVPYSVTNQVPTTVQNKCPGAAITYPSWVASENGGNLVPGCYNTILFDINTSISSSYNGDSNPAKVYVKGNITLNKSVTVNNNGDPKALRIYSQGGDTAEFNKGTTAAPTKFYGIINSATLRCTDTSINSMLTGPVPAPDLLIYGSLVCSNVNFGSGTVIWWDELAGEIQDDENLIHRIWFVESIEEI